MYEHDPRRRHLLLGTGCLWLGLPASLLGQSAAPGVPGFLQLSTVLTAVPDLAPALAARHLDALLAEAGMAGPLQQLWELGGFATATPARTIEDLQQRGLAAEVGLQALADRITLQWYSGIHVAADGTQQVIDYTGALAWRSLGYRPAGPSTCGGPFGHWAAVPEQA